MIASRLKKMSQAAGVLAAGVGLLGLLGWATGIEVLKSFWPGRSLGGSGAGWHSTDMDQVVIAGPLIFIFAILIYFSARMLNRLDTERELHARQVEQLKRELEARAEQRTVELVRANAALEGEIGERQRAEAELKVCARQSQALAQLGQRALEEHDLSRLLQEAVVLTAQTLEVEYCKVLELLPLGEALLLRAGVGWSEGLVGQATVGTGTDSEAGYTLRSHEPVIVEDMGTESRFSGAPLLHQHHVVSGMSVIIAGKERPFGVLGAHTTRRRIFALDDVHFLQGVANVMGGAIARKERVHQHTAELEKTNLSLLAQIVERRHAEEQIKGLNAELRQRLLELNAVNQELEAFTSSVSHDLRAPLRHMDSFARILAEDFAARLDPEALHYLGRIQQSAQHMGQLVDGLLKLARLGRQALICQDFDLTALAREVVAELESELSGRQVEWRIAELPRLRCDPALVKQVLANLLANAAKFTRQRAPAVIEVGRTQADGQPAIFVRDNGAGFSMKYVHKLFVPFQRLHRVEEFEGTGIGLATAQRIVYKHGGKIWAEGEPDRGATFYFTLGVQEVRAPGQPVESAA